MKTCLCPSGILVRPGYPKTDMRHQQCRFAALGDACLKAPNDIINTELDSIPHFLPSLSSGGSSSLVPSNHQALYEHSLTGDYWCTRGVGHAGGGSALVAQQLKIVDSSHHFSRNLTRRLAVP